MKELINYMVTNIVDNPGSVNISEIEGEQITIFKLKVAPEDIGKVIGKKGRIIKAMRIILGVAASKLQKRAVLEIIE